MPTCGRLRSPLVPTRTVFRLQRPHPGDRLTIMHRAHGGPSTSADRSTVNTTPRGTAQRYRSGPQRRLRRRGREALSVGVNAQAATSALQIRRPS